MSPWDLAPVCLLRWTPALRLEQRNERAARELGATPGCSVAEVVRDGAAEVEAMLRAARDGEVDVALTTRGAGGVWEWRASRVVEEGAVTGVISSAMRAAGPEAEGAADVLAAIIDAVPTAVIGLDLDGCVRHVWNRAAERMLGWKAHEVMGRFLPTVPQDKAEEFEGFRALIRSGRTLEGVDVTRRRKDGSPIDYSIYTAPLHDASGRIAGNIAVLVDITERKRAEAERHKLEAQLRQSQKMEAVGRLAGGIAHDFNNMLSVILGTTELMRHALPAKDALLDDIGEIEGAALRSKELTEQLLAFSRKQPTRPRVLFPDEQIAHLQKTLGRLVGEDVEVRVFPATDPWPVEIDASQLDQVLVNLAVNARDAMASGGTLTIETANLFLDETYCAQHEGFTPGPWVMIAVTDTGVGMDAETRAHLFEPFFTTKALGRGTGMGLAMVYGIVRQNGGGINVYSEPGQGTSIKVYFPRATGEGVAPIPAVEAIVPSPKGLHVLLVEDEPAVRQVVARMLDAVGCVVTVAERPSHALSLASDDERRFDLLLTDVVMPEMSGRALRDAISRVRPEMKTLFMSGYTANVIVHHNVLDPGVHLLRKPFTVSELLAQLRAAME